MFPVAFQDKTIRLTQRLPISRARDRDTWSVRGGENAKSAECQAETSELEWIIAIVASSPPSSTHRRRHRQSVNQSNNLNRQ